MQDLASGKSVHSLSVTMIRSNHRRITLPSDLHSFNQIKMKQISRFLLLSALVALIAYESFTPAAAAPVEDRTGGKPKFVVAQTW